MRKPTKRRTVDLYEVFCGVLYLLKSGCQWRMLPSEFPKWRTVHAYFAKWSEPGPDGMSVLEQALKNVVDKVRTRQGRRSSTNFLIVDAQSVENTDSAREKGYDAGKKVSGIKRHITDTQGFPHAIAVMTADVTDASEHCWLLAAVRPIYKPFRASWSTVNISVSHLPRPLKNCLGPRLKLPGAVSCTLLQ